MNTISDKEYERRVNLIEDLVDFHPEYLRDLGDEDRAALSRYYFAGREVDVESIFQYRRELLEHDPSAEQRAEQAWLAFRKRARL